MCIRDRDKTALMCKKHMIHPKKYTHIFWVLCNYFDFFLLPYAISVSYTHLDVYKRQISINTQRNYFFRCCKAIAFRRLSHQISQIVFLLWCRKQFYDISKEKFITLKMFSPCLLYTSVFPPPAS